MLSGGRSSQPSGANVDATKQNKTKQKMLNNISISTCTQRNLICPDRHYMVIAYKYKYIVNT